VATADSAYLLECTVKRPELGTFIVGAHRGSGTDHDMHPMLLLRA
jgi:hypothetical protein